VTKLIAFKPNGQACLALELDPANIHCLKQDKPILLHLDKLFPLGIPAQLEILIAYTETPVASAASAKPIADVMVDERQVAGQAAHPHCPECRSTIESVGVLRNQTALAIAFCPACGCFLGLVASDLTRGMTRNFPVNGGSERTQ